MARNDEVIRQWTLLQCIATSRAYTIQKLATELRVSTRTVRRDLEALQAAGFPIRDETVNGTKFWRMDARPLGALARSGLTVAELSALYFSRALLECFAGTQVLADLQSALNKVEAALTPAMKKFLDQLPRVIGAKRQHSKRQDTHTYQVTAKLLDAILRRRVLTMQYRSLESRREKLYTVHPYRLVQAEGGLYLMALVPAYSELRTFAVERIRKVSPLESTFEAIAELESDPFQNSLGVHRGPATRIQLRFHPQVADYVRERTFHPSQQLKDRSDGSVTMTLAVSDDYALRSWILGFGRYVRVLAPRQLADWARDEHGAAEEQYESGSEVRIDSDVQPPLPFLFGRTATA